MRLIKSAKAVMLIATIALSACTMDDARLEDQRSMDIKITHSCRESGEITVDAGGSNKDESLSSSKELNIPN